MMAARRGISAVLVLVLVLALAFGFCASAAGDLVPFAGPGPVLVAVARVVDGDTLIVILPGGTSERVRLRGIDTPELHGHCPSERAAALAARAAAVRLVQDAARVDLVEIAPRREVWGRMLARVRVDGVALDARLLALGHGVPYAGGHRAGWCPVQPAP